MTDLETAARELAQKSLRTFELAYSCPDVFLKETVALLIYETFLAGAAHMQKRIEELEQISKMLEEALEWISDETKRDHREPDLYTRYGCVLHKATEALAEVQKLRANESP